MGKLQELKQQWNSKSIEKPEYIQKMKALHQTLFDYSEILSTNEILSIEISSEGVFITIGAENIKLKCDEQCARTAPIETLNFNNYELHERTHILNLLKEKTTAPFIVDVGANVGFYSLFLAKHFPKGKIMAFEPLPQNFELLKENLELNKAINIEILNRGLSKEEGSLEFYIDPNCAVNASLKNVSDSKNVQVVKCPVSTMDIHLKNRSQKVDFIKIDVEGGEFFVLQGAMDLLVKDKPMVFAEMLRKWCKPFGYHPNDIIQYMVDLNYKCLAVAPDGNLKNFKEMTEDTTETNFFFVQQ